MLVAAACSKNESASTANEKTASEPAETARVDLGGLSFMPSNSWRREQPANRMRLAQFSIGDAPEAATLVVFHFGKDGGGGVEQNVQRWLGQFDEAPGEPNIERAKIVERTVAGLQVTTVDLRGTYVGMRRPGAPAPGKKPDHRLLGAIAVSPAGPYFFKLVGPAVVVDAAQADFAALIESIEPPKP